MIISVIVVRYVLLPIIGVGVVKLAGQLGFLPDDPLYRFVLMVQFTLPPAMNIGTCFLSLTQLSRRRRRRHYNFFHYHKIPYW